jgi:hypothetical protein
MLKTTEEIRALVTGAKLNFAVVENQALNNYLPKIFNTCPFTEEVCTGKQCIECAVSKSHEAKALKRK